MADPGPAPVQQVPAAGGGNGDLCRLQEFSEFIRMFSQQPGVQRRYTRLPLEYGYLDTDLIGTDQENNAFKTKSIARFEDIPGLRRGAIFPDRADMKRQGLKSEITTRANSKDADPEKSVKDPNAAIVTLSGSDNGILIHYRFRRTDGCWSLYGISDRST